MKDMVLNLIRRACTAFGQPYYTYRPKGNCRRIAFQTMIIVNSVALGSVAEKQNAIRRLMVFGVFVDLNDGDVTLACCEEDDESVRFACPIEFVDPEEYIRILEKIAGIIARYEA